MHSNFSCLCSHGLYFSFLHFTLVRCMIQSRPVAGSTRSPYPSPTASGLGQFRFASQFRFRFCLPAGFGSVLLVNWFLVLLTDQFQFRFACRLVPICLPTSFWFSYQPVSGFACQPVRLCLLVPVPIWFPLPAGSIFLPTSFGNLATFILLDKVAKVLLAQMKNEGSLCAYIARALNFLSMWDKS